MKKIYLCAVLMVTGLSAGTADSTAADTAYGSLTWQVSLDVNPFRLWFSRHVQLTGVRFFGGRHGLSLTPQILFSQHTAQPGMAAAYRYYFGDGYRGLFLTGGMGVVPFFLGYREEDATSGLVIYEETDAVAGFQAGAGAGWTIHEGPGFTADILAELTHTVFLTEPSRAYRGLMDRKGLSLDDIERTGVMASVRLGIVL